MDDNGNKKLDFEEFKKGMIEYGLNYTKEEMKELFNLFDKDKSGQIDFDEFLEHLRVRKVFRALNFPRYFESLIISNHLFKAANEQITSRSS